MGSEADKQWLGGALVGTEECPASQPLTKAQFQRLADVPLEVEWFANLKSAKTRRACRNDVGAFMRFAAIRQAAEFRTVTPAHVIAWRKSLEIRRLAAASIRRKLSAVSDLFD